MISYIPLTPLFVFLANILALASFNKEVEHYSVLESSKIVQLNEDYSVVYKVEKTILIWDKKGLRHAKVNIPTDQFTSLIHFEAEVINPASGRVQKKYKVKDLEKLRIIDGVSFYDDYIDNSFSPASISPPVKIKVSYEYVTRGNYYFSSFYPYDYYNQKVKKSSLEFIYPESIGLRYKLKNVEEPDITRSEGKRVSLRWTFEDLTTIEKYEKESYPRIFFAPQKFSLDGYAGSMDTWGDLARWFHLLNKDKGILPEDFKIKVNQMVEGVDDELEKATILYKYIQKNYRYVAISLGIGGWMSAPAEETIKNKYGECKALSTLLKAMLSEVGITSQYVLVRAGKNSEPIESDFVMNQFNHVFLRIPIGDKIYWTECTSPYGLLGFSGTFTHDRDVLIVSEDGGYLTHTPDFKGDEFNSISSHLNVILHENGHAQVNGQNSYNGFLAAEINAYKYYLDKKAVTDFLLKKIGGKGLNFDSYTLNENNIPDLPAVQVEFEGTIQHYAYPTAKRVIIPSQWVDIHEDLLPVGKLKYISVINVLTDLEFEKENGNMNTSSEYFSIQTLAKKTDKGLLIEQEIQIEFPDDIADELKASQLYKINSLAKTDILLKKH